MTVCILSKNSIVHHSYSYPHALQTGALIDVTQIAQLVGMEFSVALTVDVWEIGVRWSSVDTLFAGIYQSEEKRLCQLLSALQKRIETCNREQNENDLFLLDIVVKNRDNPPCKLKTITLCYQLATYGKEGEPILIIALAKTE
jgi:hypothetical protein